MQWEQFNFEALRPVRWSNLGKHKRLATIGLIVLIAGVVSVPVIIFLADVLTDSVTEMAKISTFGIGIGSVLTLVTGSSMIAGAWSAAHSDRIAEFIKSNKGKLRFDPAKSVQGRNGVLFHRDADGKTRGVAAEFSGQFGIDYSFGNLQRNGRRIGYVYLKLPRRLPHMILDATKNNKTFRSNLPIIIRKNQGLSLEGDFDNHYELYVPKEYEQDALYVFTPDVMSLLIGSGAKYDVEIIDDSLYLYSNKQFDFLDDFEMKQLLWLIEGLGEKIYRRVDGYRDDRVDNAKQLNKIAEQGRELYRMERASVTFKAMSPEKRNMFVTLFVILSIILLLAIAALIIVIKVAAEV